MIFIETSVIDLLVVIVGADQNDYKFFINQGRKRDFLDEFIRKKPSSSNSIPGVVAFSPKTLPIILINKYTF